MATLRLAYAVEFLIALIAAFTTWSQVGGQGHLDIMPWYWKLFPVVGIAVAAVRATKAAVEGEQVWNSRTLRWLAVILTLILVCGLVTYYYHLYEPEEDDEEQTVTESSGPQIRPLDAYWAHLHAEKGLLIRK